jgi:hypothetical protein
MADTLEELSKSFPKLQDWKTIYSYETMKELVAQVYKQIIDFSRGAVSYFKIKRGGHTVFNQNMQIY